MKKMFKELNARELLILQLMAQGLSNQEIANECFSNLLTVKARISSVYFKLFKNEIIPNDAQRVRAVLWYLENVKHIDLGGKNEKRRDFKASYGNS